jgi:hypothetical protein
VTADTRRTARAGKYHAAVTAGTYDRRVLITEQPSGPGKTGALLLRVWLEGTGCEAQLRIRLVSRHDLTKDAEATASASTIEETLAYVRDWLERFARSGP